MKSFRLLQVASSVALSSFAVIACGSSDSSPATTTTADSGTGSTSTGDAASTTPAADGSTGTTTAAEGTASISGTVQGVSLAGLKTALADVMTDPTNGKLTVTMTDTEACANVASGASNKGAKFLMLTFFNESTTDAGEGGSTAPTAPGTYSAAESSDPTSLYVYAEYSAFDGTCTLVNDGVEKWRSGTATITSLAGGVVSGTFDLTGGDISNGADHLTGNFTTASCSGSSALYDPATKGACN